MKNYISRGLTLEFENVETSDLAANLGVRSLPTFAIMDHNVLMDMAIGSQSATDLEEFIDNNL